MKIYKDDFNHKRIIFENFISHELYTETHDSLDKRCLKKIYCQLFLKLYLVEKSSLFLSLKTFYHLS
jgi:hypothetical protein